VACDAKPAVSLKRSRLEPKLGLLLRLCYRVCIETRVQPIIGDKSGDLRELWLWLLFRGSNFFTTNVSHATKFGNVGVWPVDTYFLNFVNFGGVP